ncbi:Neuropeptide Y receptor [Blomia tropicalis]|nr:Neuropeptide Y receptor [Blomia tropicalis]
MESLSITERITNLPSIDYASSNVTPLSIDGESLNQLRVQIETLLSETYRFERIIYALAYGLIVVISFFGNLLVCRVCMRNMTKTNALIMSLAASDLLMTLFNIPFNFFRLLNYSWPFGSLMCFIVNFVQHLVVYISSYTMAVIAIQRYRSVCGFHYQLVNGERTETNSSDADLTSKQPAKVYKCCTTCLSFVIGLITCQFLERMCIPRTQRIYSMRTIFIAIVVVWICSAFVSALFTYSSSVVEREDFFSTILWNLYDVNSTKINTFNKTVNDAIGYGIESTELDSPEFNNNIETSIHVVFRCQNPLPHGVDSFFKQYSIKADLAKTVVIFVTQYFIPLAVSCGCYVRIGKIITQQGKIATIRGNPKARIRQKKKRRRILVLVLVCASFAICWLPIHLFHLLTDAGLFNYNYQIFMMLKTYKIRNAILEKFHYQPKQPR